LAVLLELGLEQLEEGEGVGGGAGEAGQDLAVAAEAAHLARVGLHHRVAEGHLAVAGDGDAALRRTETMVVAWKTWGFWLGSMRASGGWTPDVGPAPRPFKRRQSAAPPRRRKRAALSWKMARFCAASRNGALSTPSIASVIASGHTIWSEPNIRRSPRPAV